MACMEHTCKHCGHLVLNNVARYQGIMCPKCGGSAWTSVCDEDQAFREQARDERMERRDRRNP